MKIFSSNAATTERVTTAHLATCGFEFLSANAADQKESLIPPIVAACIFEHRQQTVDIAHFTFPNVHGYRWSTRSRRAFSSSALIPATASTSKRWSSHSQSSSGIASFSDCIRAFTISSFPMRSKIK